MTKKTDSSKSSRAERREERRNPSDDSVYKMRSAASRRAEARARAAYRGIEPGMEGPDASGIERAPAGMRSADVGLRANMEAVNRPKKKHGEMDQAMVAQLLHNPTRLVSESTLRAQYGYVVNDVRSMAILSAGLFALLIALALILPN